ncbi:MAG: cell division protein SepF [Clostridia bacterium]|jgi:cell division inhibitor SepF
MGLFDWIMRGIGFEGSDEPMQKSSARYNTNKKSRSKYVKFDLHNNPSMFESNNVMQMPASFGGGYAGAGRNVIVYAPHSQRDVQLLVDYLRKKEPAIVNLGGLNDADAQRIIDFISGSIYALKGSIHPIMGDLYLIAPEGTNIMIPTEEGVMQAVEPSEIQDQTFNRKYR